LNDVLFAFLLTLLAGLATGLGGVIALFAKRDNRKFLSACLSLSVGVMLYVSFVEIFAKADESLGYALGERGYLAATIAFFAGIALIALIDKCIPHHDHGEGQTLERMGLTSALAIAIHNFPEGLVTFMAALQDPALGIAIAAAIAIHNIPEGIAIAAPIYYATGSKTKALLLSTASGLTEPLGALVAYVLLAQVLSYAVFGIVFAAAGGMMVYISMHQLLPVAESFGNHKLVTRGIFAGMAIMALSLVLL